MKRPRMRNGFLSPGVYRIMQLPALVKARGHRNAVAIIEPRVAAPAATLGIQGVKPVATLKGLYRFRLKPFQGLGHVQGPLTQGSRCAATLGCVILVLSGRVGRHAHAGHRHATPSIHRVLAVA